MRSPDRDSPDGYALQDRLLPGVSRTFALTIPQLPPDLRPVVTNAYLLCRTADTIEDEVSLDRRPEAALPRPTSSPSSTAATRRRFAADLAPRLSVATLPAEHALISRPRVSKSHTPRARQRAAIERCVRIMCDGMPAVSAARTPERTRRRAVSSIATATTSPVSSVKC